MANTSNLNKSGSGKFTSAIVIIFVLLTLILSPLIGLVGVLIMWVKTNWSKNAKILITIIFIVMSVINIGGVLFLKAYVPKHPAFQMAGQSMEPGYKNGAYFLTNKYSDNASLVKGQVIVMRNPNDPQSVVMKRIVGVPEDVIKIENGQVFLNGTLLKEEYVGGTKTYGGSFLKEGQEVSVPQGMYFVMGDNRPYSADSREYGFVPAGNIISIVSTCYKNCN